LLAFPEAERSRSRPQTDVTGGTHGTNEPLSEAHPAGKGLQGLSTSGPVVLYNASFASLVVAPMDHAKSAVHFARRPHTVWECGVSSELTSLPRGFEHRTMLVAGDGVSATLARWGALFQRAHRTDRSFVEIDKNVQFLSYWVPTRLARTRHQQLVVRMLLL
jgi:hypothetical protein